MVRYQYTPVDVRYVKENPEEYIIPDCLDACKILWDKGIDTHQCSNFEDKDERWIEIRPYDLSKENKELLDELIYSREEGYVLGGMTRFPRLTVKTTGEEAKKRLCELASVLMLQDTSDYVTEEAYLDSFRRKDGSFTYVNGEVIRDYNPKYVDATLEDALTFNGDWDLYIEEEHRIYGSKEALDIHRSYLDKNNNEDNNGFHR